MLRPTRQLPRQLIRGLLLSTLLSTAAVAEPRLPGQVIRVIDGDSLILDVRGGRYQIDLDGIDAPEPNQPWGDTATASLQRTLVGAFVVVQAQAGSRGRLVRGSIAFKGRDVALDLLHDGLAWSTVGVEPGRVDPGDNKDMRTPKTDPEHRYTQAERIAREAGRGLWSDAQAIPPWQWRRRAGPLR